MLLLTAMLRYALSVSVALLNQLMPLATVMSPLPPLLDAVVCWVTSEPPLSVAAMVPASVASIVKSTGSSSHAPPLPALTLPPVKLKMCPEVSMKPPRRPWVLMARKRRRAIRPHHHIATGARFAVGRDRRTGVDGRGLRVSHGLRQKLQRRVRSAGPIAANQHGAARRPAGIDPCARRQANVLASHHHGATGLVAALGRDGATDHDLAGADQDSPPLNELRSPGLRVRAGATFD